MKRRRWFIDCAPEILSGLGQMYAAEGEMKDNIDAAGGKGAALFAHIAIKTYCRSTKWPHQKTALRLETCRHVYPLQKIAFICPPDAI